VASHFALELEGKVNGFLRSAEGGGLSAQVLTYQQGPTIDTWRQIGRPKFDDITLSVGMGMSPYFYKWIAAFFERDCVRKDGAIIGGDFNFVQRTKRTFLEALISEVGIPALDGSSKEAAYVTVKIVPETMTYETISGSAKIECPPGLNQPSKLWQAANFTFTIDGYEDSFKRTMKVDAFSIKQQILEYPVGHLRTSSRVPGRLEIPNISVYIPAVDADKVTNYATSRIVGYKAAADNQMTGALTFIGADQAPLCTIHMRGMDIVSAEPQKFDAAAETMHMVKVQVQVENMAFEYVNEATY
jgi:hypothetical protein